jgi:glycosyltransferase involved in cell wall biosynthesis
MTITDALNSSDADSISVVIPTFKRPDRLIVAIRSAASQVPMPLEIIVSDNDASESARDVCESPDLPDVVYVNSSQKSGASHARNVGVLVARGAWLAFLDDDDHWLPQYLAQALETGTSASAEMVLTPTLRELDGELNFGKTPLVDSDIDSLLSGGNFGVVGSNIFITNQCFKALGGFDQTMPTSEDIDLLARFVRGRFNYAVGANQLVVQTVHSEGRLSDHGSTIMYQGIARLLEKHAPFVNKSARRKLTGQVHMRGYFAEHGVRNRLRHLVLAKWNGNNTPAGDVVRKMRRIPLFWRRS